LNEGDEFLMTRGFLLRSNHNKSRKLNEFKEEESNRKEHRAKGIPERRRSIIIRKRDSFTVDVKKSIAQGMITPDMQLGFLVRKERPGYGK
jgi:hypothetical protein